MRSIYLIGFMGTGKSTTASALSARTGMPVIEMDEEIVRRKGMPITEIFASEGEASFRQTETALLREIAEGAPAIVSCGGGAVTVPENVRLMKESGTVVLLTSSPEEILARVRGSDERPLLNGHMDADYIRGMLQKRERFYLEAADMIVSTDGKETGRIVPEILRQLEQTTTGN